MAGERRITVPLAQIPEGSSVVRDEETGLLVHRRGSDLAACTDRCRHMGGRLDLVEGTDLAMCPRHGWTLDLATMRYRNPAGGPSQPTVDTAVHGHGPDPAVTFTSRAMTDWSASNSGGADLDADELTIEFWAHACCEITVGGKRLVTDPWLIGPAFSRGWWLAHEPPADWRERLASSDWIYISHNHSDHLNVHTLRDLVARNADVHLLVPAFPSGSVARPLRQMGFTRVHEVAVGEWSDLGPDLRAMVLGDEAGRDDSALLIDHRGHLILNTVDCSNPNGLDLPAPVDLLLCAFAGGATGFPVCWTELYGEEEVRRRVAVNRASVRSLVTDIVAACRPRIAVPFAGYFEEAHPADAEIAELNTKNSWVDFERAVARADAGTRVWLPASGQRLDVGRSLEPTGALHLTQRSAARTPNHRFAEYTDQITAVARSVPETDAALEAYFAWAGARFDLLLHVIETSEDFSEVIRERFIDLRTGEVTTTMPDEPVPQLRMRVRSDVFRWTMATGAPWEEISIGFQARFFRQPDHYNLDFWDHFQNRLPSEPADLSSGRGASPVTSRGSDHR